MLLQRVVEFHFLWTKYVTKVYWAQSIFLQTVNSQVGKMVLVKTVKDKRNLSPNLMAAELPLIWVQPFDCFKTYVLSDCIDADK